MKKQFFDLISDLLARYNKKSEEIESYKDELLYHSLELCNHTSDDDYYVYIWFVTEPVQDIEGNLVKNNESLRMYKILEECGFDESNSMTKPFMTNSFSFSGLIKMNDNFKKNLKDLLKIHCVGITILGSPRIENHKPKIDKLYINSGVQFKEGKASKHVVSVEGDDDMINKYNKGEFFSQYEVTT